MKTFTATELNKSPQDVFDAAKEGAVLIEHGRHRGGEFMINWVPFKKDAPYPEWNAYVEYEAGSTVMFNGQECVITETFSLPVKRD